MVYQYIQYIGHLGIGDYFSSMAFLFHRLQEEVIMSTIQQETPIMCLMTGQHFLTIWLSQLGRKEELLLLLEGGQVEGRHQELGPGQGHLLLGELVLLDEF